MTSWTRRGKVIVLKDGLYENDYIRENWPPVHGMSEHGDHWNWKAKRLATNLEGLRAAIYSTE